MTAPERAPFARETSPRLVAASLRAARRSSCARHPFNPSKGNRRANLLYGRVPPETGTPRIGQPTETVFPARTVPLATRRGGNSGAFIIARAAQPQPSAVEWMTVDELKEKLSRGETLAIIDVRATETYVGSDGKIKGAVHVRLRRLRARLAQPPLKDLPRDREVVTYCACPNDEAAVRAAELFLDAGFTRVRVLRGGWNSWLTARGQVESKPRG